MRAAAALLVVAASSQSHAAEVNGFVDSRSQFTRARVKGLLPTSDVPQLSELLELNAQVKHAYGDQGSVFGDLSLIAQLAGMYRALGVDGVERDVGDHPTAASRPLVSLNELYLSHELRPELTVLVGKKRLVFGSGLAHNPTDLLNPPKDPTDPSFQRAGAYLARIEVPLEKYAFTVLFSALVTDQAHGLPARFLTYPSWGQVDSQAHYLMVARAYTLLADSDVNLMLFYGNRYNDLFERKLRGGASFSRYFLTDYELHIEALLQAGSARYYPDAACLTDRVSAFSCVARGDALFERSRLHEKTLRPRVLVGTRRMFSDESLVSLEYLFQSDGYTRAELQDFVDAAALTAETRRQEVSLPLGALGARVGAEGVPQKFSFEPLSRHYLFATYQKPRIRDDFTAALMLVTSLTDLSGIVSPSLKYSATEWLELTASAFVPYPGPRQLSMVVPELGTRVSEYTLAPMEHRWLLEARAYY